ncbi:MAG: hypothetical protein AAB974_01770 [Patescibacteria group bacterium]
MRFNPDIHRRQSIRLCDFDYGSAGAYFVTVVTRERECLFGDVAGGVMVLNDAGRIVETWWNELPVAFPNVVTDAFVVMPNHMHGIVVITDVGAGIPRPMPAFPRPDRRHHAVPIGGAENAPLRRVLGDVVRFVKYESTFDINISRNTPGIPVWQRNYWERVVRNESELNRIRQYIIDNPVNWATDEERPR